MHFWNPWSILIKTLIWPIYSTESLKKDVCLKDNGKCFTLFNGCTRFNFLLGVKIHVSHKKNCPKLLPLTLNASPNFLLRSTTEDKVDFFSHIHGCCCGQNFVFDNTVFMDAILLLCSFKQKESTLLIAISLEKGIRALPWIIISKIFLM